MTWPNKILKFFNILDNEDKLSISNIAILLVLIKGVATSFGMQDLVVFITLILNYIHKRYTNNKAITVTKSEQVVEDITKTVDGLKTEIAAHKDAIQQDILAYKDSYEKILKQSEEVKKMISDSNLSRAFNPRNKML